MSDEKTTGDRYKDYRHIFEEEPLEPGEREEVEEIRAQIAMERALEQHRDRQ